ncbi:MAG: hypothetical protein PHE55_20675 [Methylococcaceae bacterium]|nr:hypothetical protein [Methylococcaceae bacterium]
MMETTQQKSPDRRANADQGRIFTYSQLNHSTKRKLAPFGRTLNLADQNTIAVLTGGHAWERAKSPFFWFEGRRLLLPFGDDPTAYRWPVAGRDCLVFGFGEFEPRERLIALSIELVRSGALFILWGWSDAGGPLTELPGPIFRPEPARRAA